MSAYKADENFQIDPEFKESPSIEPSKILCNRCQRVGARIGCANCAKRRQAERETGPKTTKPDKPMFDDKKLRDQIGRLSRMMCEREQVFGKSKASAACLQALEVAITRFDQLMAIGNSIDK